MEDQKKESKRSVAEFAYELTLALREFFEGRVENGYSGISISLSNGHNYIIKITEA